MKVSTTSPFFSVALLVISMLSIQCSASLAKSVFPIIGPEATTALRLMFAALVLLPVMRPWRAKLTRKQWLPIILYGLSTGVMNMCFYQAISRIPLGVGVALEFTGPLAIAMLGSRRLIDFLWIALAVGGLLLLLPIHEFSGNLDPVGVAFALGAGFSMSVLPLALLLGVFSSALPYGLEIVALKQLPAQTFGILMSMEPFLAALSGIIFLGEQLNVAQWVALACIIVASIGATLTIRRKA